MKKLILIIIFLLFICKLSFASGRGMQVDSFLTGFRDNTTGAVLSNGYIEVYKAGTSTVTYLYTDWNLNTTHSNPITLNSAGKHTDPLYAKGTYKFLIYNSDSTLVDTWDNLQYFNSQDVSGTEVLAFDYGTLANDTTLDSCMSANTDSTTIIISDSTWNINNNLSVNTRFQVEIQKGAILKPATGVTFTFARTSQIKAGDYQIFDWAGTGNIVFTVVDAPIKSVWWGNTQTGTTFAKAEGSCNGATVILSDTCTISASLTTDSTNTIKLESGGYFNIDTSCVLTFAGDFDAPKHKIFTDNNAGSGVRFNEIDEVRAEWWGLLVGNAAGNETANNTALQYAIDCAAGNTTSTPRPFVHMLKLPSGIIRYSGGLEVPTNTNGWCKFFGIKGATPVSLSQGQVPDELTDGGGFTILYYTGSDVAIRLRGFGISITDLIVCGTSSGLGGILIGDKNATGGSASANDNFFQNMVINGFTKTDAYGLGYDEDSNTYGNVFDNCSFAYNYYNVMCTVTMAVGTGYATHQTFRNCRIEFATKWGLYTDTFVITTWYFNNCLFQHNQGDAIHVVNGQGGYTFYSPYFESNNETIAGYTVYFSAGQSTSLHYPTAIYNPMFNSGGGSMTGQLYVQDVSEFVIYNVNHPKTVPFTITRRGRTPGFQVVPNSQAQSALGNLISNVADIFDTSSRAIIPFNQHYGDSVSNIIKDYSGQNTEGDYYYNAGATIGGTIEPPDTHGSPLSMYMPGTSSYYWEFDDDGDLSFPDQTMSIVALCMFETAQTTNRVIAAKYDTTGAREWRLYTDGNGYITFETWDESSGGKIGYQYQTAVDPSIWYRIIATHGAGAAVSTINLWINGTDVTVADISSGAYTDMENLTAKMGCYDITSGKVNLFRGNISFLGLTNEELSTRKIKALDALLAGYAGGL